ncbi:hypothetical protein [Streptomyces fulvoviolaceus]|uniref:hypothetical protein n=1 Tax=Streptomyces fulvoviolaceus TaxID=285535 RepID=UPI0004C6E21C|nr:hypothetical protein [Streptomyces fulvoviolaceus]
MPDPLIHPHETLTTRDGEQVEIDAEMVPTIRELWRLNFTTLACCQDVGEATAGVRAQNDKPLGYGADSFIAYHRGWALLKLPITDAMRLVAILAEEPAFADRVRRRWRPGSWRMDVPLVPDGLDEAALLHFPR